MAGLGKRAGEDPRLLGRELSPGRQDDQVAEALPSPLSAREGCARAPRPGPRRAARPRRRRRGSGRVAPFQPSSISEPRSSLARARDRARAEQVARAQRRAVRGQVGDHLRRAPVELARVRGGDPLAVELDLERDVERPRRLVAGTGAARAPAAARRGAARARRAASPRREIDVANDLPRKGPSGRYSHACRSRALQSLSSTTPKTCSSASLDRARARRARSATPIDEARARARCRAARLGPNAGSPSSPQVLPARPHDVGAADDDRARAAVVADGQPPPVGQQRLAAGAEDPAEVRGVVQRGVEVGVVARRRTAGAARRRRGDARCASARGSPRSAPSARAVAAQAPGPRGHERVERPARRSAPPSPSISPSAREPGEVEHARRPRAPRRAARRPAGEKTPKEWSSGPHAAG